MGGAVVSVLHFKPTFVGPTRDRLATPEIEPLVAGAVEMCLRRFAAERPQEARELVEWVLGRARQRR
jgi:topoisomerase-4 subunit B